MTDEIKNNNNPIKTEQPAPKETGANRWKQTPKTPEEAGVKMPKEGRLDNMYKPTDSKYPNRGKTESPFANSSKALNKMGLDENDLEPIDQSPLYKAKMAAIEAGEKGGYRDYSDFNEKGELVARPARTVSLLGDSNKFHPDAQIRGIKDFGDHFEYQLKNPEDADFRDFRYDEKNGDWSKDLWDFKQKDEARIKANKNKFDISKYPDVEKTPYGFVYNVNGESITDLKEQDREFGRNVDDNKNYGFTVTKDGDEVYYETFEDAYNAAKGINSNDDDEEKEYDNIDDDYERSYGPVTNDKEYQAYLKWKENGDSFDNIDGKIRNQMGLGNENSQVEADVKKLLDLTDNKYGITLSNAIDDLKKYPEDSLLGDNKAISQLMNRFGLSKEDVIKALNYKFDGLI